MTLYFYFPFKEVSGVPVLFLNLARYLAKNYKEHSISIIDYPDGYMASSLLSDDNINLIHFYDGKSLRIENGHIIMQSILPFAIRPELLIGPETKILFWNLFPDIFIPKVFPLNVITRIFHLNTEIYLRLVKFFCGSLMERIKNFVELAVINNSLYFMDEPNLERTGEIVGLEFSRNNYLPIISYNDLLKQYFTHSERVNEIHISFIGRLCDFKYRSVELLLLKLSKIAVNQNFRIIFHIIGDGPFINYLKNLKVTNKNFEAIFKLTIPKMELDYYLVEKIDLNISMGTSALESARLKIPTLIVDYSYERISQDYKFRWLHETSNYDLGHLITKKDIEPGNKSLEAALLEVRKNCGTLSNLGFSYFVENHSIEIISQKLIQIIQKGLLPYKNYNPFFFKKGRLRKIHEFLKYKQHI